MLLSVIIPVLNEAETLAGMIDRLREALATVDWEVIFIDDGSTDGSLDIIRRAAFTDGRIKAVSFTRNFGHQAAITAGLDFAGGDAVAILDADLQDPPELLPEMLELLQQGYDVISPRRTARKGETLFKRWTAAVFYRIMAGLTEDRLASDVGDFRMFSRRAVHALRLLREQHRFLRGLVTWLGLKETFILYERQPRAAGETKYPLMKMFRFAWTAVSSFSALPLRLSIGAGLVVSFAGFGYLVYALYVAFVTKSVVPGWTSIVVLQCLFSGMILLALGVVGDYVARSYEESKGRPLYVVTAAINSAQLEYEIPRAAVLIRSEGPAWRAIAEESSGASAQRTTRGADVGREPVLHLIGEL